MFAVKNMDALLTLKLDMVYRSLSMEEAQKRFSEATQPTPVEKPKLQVPTSAPAPAPAPSKPVRKVVKPIKPKSK